MVLLLYAPVIPDKRSHNTQSALIPVPAAARWLTCRHMDGGLDLLNGLTALLESGVIEATGTVTAVGMDTVTVTCDEDSWKGERIDSIAVSVFAPDALYRLAGPAAVSGLDITVGPEPKVERIQRRKWPRRRLDLPVTVCPVEDGRHLAGVPGRTVDIGMGGTCVETLRPLEGEGNPMLILNLPNGTSLVTLTTTVGVEDLGDGWRYRLAFSDLDDHDRSRLADLLQPA